MASLPGTLHPDLCSGFSPQPILYMYASIWSSWQYGGETSDAHRRASEYISRILQSSECTSPQPFFGLIHRNSKNKKSIAWRLSHWSLVPFARASVLRLARLDEEQHAIRTLQFSLIPPLVHKLLAKFVGMGPGASIVSRAFTFDPDVLKITTSRKFCRQRRSDHSPNIQSQAQVRPFSRRPEVSEVSVMIAAASGKVQGECAKASIQALWHADVASLKMATHMCNRLPTLV